MLLEAFPEATGVAVDFSPVMVEQARRRLKEFGSRATKPPRPTSVPPTGSGGSCRPSTPSPAAWRFIISPTTGKRALYREIFDLLRPGGTFLNCEHVASRGPWGQGRRRRGERTPLAAAAGAGRDGLAQKRSARNTSADLTVPTTSSRSSKTSAGGCGTSASRTSIASGSTSSSPSSAGVDPRALRARRKSPQGFTLG